jgi:type 1 glutamine amidotransferase
MKRSPVLVTVSLLAGFILVACGGESHVSNAIVPNVLIFTKTRAFRHESIGPGLKAIQDYFAEHGITSIQSEDSLLFRPEKLQSFDVLLFFQTTGPILDSTGRLALMQFIHSGKGFVGVHSAADTEYDWPWFSALLGARFADHPDIQSGVLIKVDSAQIATRHLPARWTRTDEWYNFKSAPTHVHVELMADESTYTGGTMGSNHPMAWYHEFEGGRVYYTALGHTVESYQDTLFLEHLEKAVRWAAKK